jgi:hypothetical protein
MGFGKFLELTGESRQELRFVIDEQELKAFSRFLGMVA